MATSQLESERMALSKKKVAKKVHNRFSSLETFRIRIG
jgi:hypothetical protein